MQRTVSAHIEQLRALVHALNDQLMQQDELRVRNELEAKVRAAEMALNHYQTALRLEESLAEEK